MHRERPRTTDRGVSEVVAFTLVFGIILGSVALVYAAGFPAILSYQESEQVSNAERAFDAMAENLNDVARYSAIEERSSEITLRGGQLTTGGESTNLMLIIEDQSGNELGSHEYELGSLVYSQDDRLISFEGGAVLRADENGGSIITKEPRFHCGEDVAVLTLLKIDASERSLSSVESQEITIRERPSPPVETYRNGGHTVRIEATGPHEMAWNNYDWDCQNVDSVTIRVTTVSLTF